MSRLLITGANGGLGQELTRLLHERDDMQILALTKAELDITDFNAVVDVVTRFQPDVVINAAAYTRVDDAETHRSDAFAVNERGAKNLAMACDRIGAKLCHISTDYVFGGGHATVPYVESDPILPLGVYGESKAAGERAVLNHCEKSFIIRTAWLYSAFGANFVRTMIRAGSTVGDEGLRVVNDQIGSPTWTRDLSQFILALIETDRYGVYHGCNVGACSWYEFAVAIFREVEMDVKVTPVTTEEFPRPAKRPSFSALESRAIPANGFSSFRSWQDALSDFVLTHREAINEWRGP
ncbi:dTDP-4-dehydrorhamnose reductase [Alicyclobacillus acidiphilus]|uniref:dTDP-4-dehydrorhamnose reductase n=1 Tax=Alicyclobacillus acidiphilus TaxID=182455 RepID=UPI00082C38E2|nr:dTDP-4-dehydrorhamnose reductase [Alicyclobacillus acidiphilus]